MIRTNGLTKLYGSLAALDELSMNVPSGAIYGFIGNNGSGKTTAIRVLATLLHPDGGEAEVAGVDVLREPAAVRAVVGYMPDFFGVYDDLRVDEYLELYGALQGMRGPAIHARSDALLDLVRLANKREAYVESLSRGMRQRLCLARALVHDPEVLLLDEPASGLDPIARIEMRDVLQDLAKLGKTVLISSHILTELSDLCTHVGILMDGAVVREGTIADVLWAAERPGYRVRVAEGTDRAAAVLATVPGVGAVEANEDGLRFHVEGGEAGAAAALAALVAAGLVVARFGPDEGSLEQAYIRITHEEGEE